MASCITLCSEYLLVLFGEIDNLYEYWCSLYLLICWKYKTCVILRCHSLCRIWQIAALEFSTMVFLHEWFIWESPVNLCQIFVTWQNLFIWHYLAHTPIHLHIIIFKHQASHSWPEDYSLDARIHSPCASLYRRLLFQAFWMCFKLHDRQQIRSRSKVSVYLRLWYVTLATRLRLRVF